MEKHLPQVSKENFVWIRILCAVLIVCFHAIIIDQPISLSVENEAELVAASSAIEQIFLKLGWIALDVLFAIGGYLVTGSMLNRKASFIFVKARILRVFPGLIFVTTMLVFIVGPVLTTQSTFDYFSHSETWKYLFGTILLVSPEFILPGIFETLPATNIINAPIWTLKYELALYAGTLIAFLLGLFKPNKRYLWMALGLAIFIHLAISIFTELRIIHPGINHLMHFGVLYLAGTLFWILRTKYNLSAILCGLCAMLAVLLNGNAFGEIFYALSVMQTTLILARLKLPAFLEKLENRDYSYGIYIWHWPICQIIYQLLPEIEQSYFSLLVIILTLPFAILSWHMIERPSLRLKAN